MDNSTVNGDVAMSENAHKGGGYTRDQMLFGALTNFYMTLGQRESGTSN